MVLARELSSDPSLLVAAEPTRGLDIAATEYVLRQLAETRSSGTGVLLVSSDLDQVMRVADRLLVLFRGRISAGFDAATVGRDEIGRHMSGVDAVSSGIGAG